MIPPRDFERDPAVSRIPAAAPGPRPEPADATRSAADVVVGWQRSHGNAAVAHLLARQEGGGGSEGGGPRRIDREDPVIRTVHGPTLGERGDYRWYVRFQLPLGAPSDGYIIQLRYIDAGEPGHWSGIEREHLWEAWRIRAGEEYPEDPTDEIGVQYDDRYTHVVVGGSDRGWNRHVGIVRFYPGPLPPEFGAERPGVTFYPADRQPSGWSWQGTRHDAYSEWDYRGGRRRVNGFVAYDGLNELRRGDRVVFRPRTTGTAATGSLTARGVTGEPELLESR